MTGAEFDEELAHVRRLVAPYGPRAVLLRICDVVDDDEFGRVDAGNWTHWVFGGDDDALVFVLDRPRGRLTWCWPTSRRTPRSVTRSSYGSSRTTTTAGLTHRANVWVGAAGGFRTRIPRPTPTTVSYAWDHGGRSWPPRGPNFMTCGSSRMTTSAGRTNEVAR